MKKIKEKPTLSERIKEKAVSTPRELLRKGLDDGSERLRTQLRDTAQHGQADEYGGDTIEDTAARGLRRAEKELTRQRKKKPQEQPPKGGAPAADATEQKPSAIKGKDTTSAVSQPQTAAERGRHQARQNAAQKATKIKTKDAYNQLRSALSSVDLPMFLPGTNTTDITHSIDTIVRIWAVPHSPTKYYKTNLFYTIIQKFYQ